MALLREDLIKQYQKIHSEKRYGYTSQNLFLLLLPFAKELAPQTILDYGCGQSKLVDMLREELDPLGAHGIKAFKYEPAIEEHAFLPVDSADLVLNTDVLEHIPAEDLAQVLKNIFTISRNALFVISNKPAREILPDGSNAHCSVYPPEWWRELIEKQFGFAKLVPWPVRSTCCIVTWDSKAVGGILDLSIKYLAGWCEKALK